MFLDTLGHKLDTGQEMSQSDLSRFISLATENNREMLWEVVKGTLRNSICEL